LSYEYVIAEVIDQVGVLTMNRPEKLNALGRGLTSEMSEVLAKWEEDDSVRVVIVTGAGNRAFSAGGDIHEMAQASESNARPPVTSEARDAWYRANYSKPTIGAINGLAYGGAAVLASSFDMRVGCENTSFRFLGAAYGRPNTTWSLPLLVGWPDAKELLMTARVVEAEEAYRMRLINYLVPASQLMDKALELGRKVASSNPRDIQGVKRLLHEGVGIGYEARYQLEQEARRTYLKPPPVKEGFKEFLKRGGPTESDEVSK
jgi:enoyl-CoA hydratase/carnithine racemase